MSTKWWTSIAAIVVAGALLAPERRVDACGPGFPTNLLLRRADALSTMWTGSFIGEAERLVRVSARDHAAFSAEPAAVTASAREEALYSAAAGKFHAEEYDDAARGFEALLRLPARERQRRSVAAAYSLGRARLATYQDVKATAAFRLVRDLVRAGFVDDDHLATASFGEEAHARFRLEDDAGALRLYAQQAAHGDAGGVNSLLEVVRRATHPANRRVYYRDDLSTALLALYFYTRGGELSDVERAAWKKELAKQATTEARGAAYMAAASYRDGDWAAAAAFARVCRHAPIATWVQAKLALRDGDRAKAEALLKIVEAAGTPGNGKDSEVPSYTLDEDPVSLVRAELGILALAGDRFPEAADWFRRGARDVEASYVIERVMSRDELLATVQRTQPLRAAPPAPKAGEDPAELCDYWSLGEGKEYCWGKLVLDIYARRALREGHYADALDAFGPRPEDDHSTDEPQLTPVQAAHDYAAARQRADAGTGIERAQQLYRASRLLREHGMEIAGTEVGPDWAIYDGSYQRTELCLPSPTQGYLQLAEPSDPYDDSWGGGSCEAPTRADTALISPLEIARLRASAPPIDLRYSYRYTASKLAEEAAGLVPPRSQAYATLLCWAAKFASREPARRDELHTKYVRNGAYGFSSGFGESCDEPDFTRARTFDVDQAERHAKAALAEERARWSWPRVRDAVWRRRAWLIYPIVGLVLLLALSLIARIVVTFRTPPKD